MERETILYRGKKYNRSPNSKRRQHRVYFWRHDKWKESPVALHRQIWIDNFGSIPKKHHIHHKDGDTFNNSIENLELISSSDHAKIHSTSPERIKKSRESIKIAIEYAKEWHGTEEGKKWHSKHSKEIWKNRKPIEVSCVQCGKKFMSKDGTGKYCSAYHGNKFRKENNPRFKKSL